MDFVQRKVRKRRLRNLMQKVNQRDKKVGAASSQLSMPKPGLFDWFSGKLVLVVALLVILPASVLGIYVYKAFNPGESFILNGVSTIVGKSLAEDADGYTNFLLIGTGDIGHDGEDLTDTLIVASLHQDRENGVMVSIPRDLFIKPESGSNQKINSYFANVSLQNEDKEVAYQALMDEVGKVVGREIHEYVRVDFSTFESVVDFLGGITVNVEETIVDTTYPGPNYSYQTFRLEQGVQVLDGATALKYARSRHTTSDFDRSRRQQELLFAIKEAAKAQGVLGSAGKIQDLYADLQAGIDTSLDIREIVRLASIAHGYDQSQLTMLQLNDDPFGKGGFLYTPPRDLYGGAFVLRPLGENYDQIHRYVALYYEYPEVMRDLPPLQLLNGTNSAGLAGIAKGVLIRFGFDVVAFGNAEQRTLTSSRLLEPTLETQQVEGLSDVLSLIFPVTDYELVPESYIEDPLVGLPWYTVELGEDAVSIFRTLTY